MIAGYCTVLTDSQPCERTEKRFSGPSCQGRRFNSNVSKIEVTVCLERGWAEASGYCCLLLFCRMHFERWSWGDEAFRLIATLAGYVQLHILRRRPITF